MSGPSVIYFDCEFTSLLDPALISIGLVAPDGDELYVELDDWTVRRCTPFVRGTVLPLLGGAGCSREEARWLVKAFLGRYPGAALCTDAVDYDAPLLAELLDEQIQHEFVAPALSGDEQKAAWSAGSEAAYAGGLRRHHALDDAKALLAGAIAAALHG